MKLRDEALKRGRIKNRFGGMTNNDHYWWEYNSKSWKKDAITPYSSHCLCKSVRAFRRRLKEAPKGVKFTLVNIYVGFDVYGYGSKKVKTI